MRNEILPVDVTIIVLTKEQTKALKYLLKHKCLTFQENVNLITENGSKGRIEYNHISETILQQLAELKLIDREPGIDRINNNGERWLAYHNRTWYALLRDIISLAIAGIAIIISICAWLFPRKS